jgi:hypothetical protein
MNELNPQGWKFAVSRSTLFFSVKQIRLLAVGIMKLIVIVRSCLVALQVIVQINQNLGQGGRWVFAYSRLNSGLIALDLQNVESWLKFLSLVTLIRLVWRSWIGASCDDMKSDDAAWYDAISWTIQGGLGNTLGGLGFVHPGALVERESISWTMLCFARLASFCGVRQTSWTSRSSKRFTDDTFFHGAGGDTFRNICYVLVLRLLSRPVERGREEQGD